MGRVFCFVLFYVFISSLRISVWFPPYLKILFFKMWMSVLLALSLMHAVPA